MQQKSSVSIYKQSTWPSLGNGPKVWFQALCNCIPQDIGTAIEKKPEWTPTRNLIAGTSIEQVRGQFQIHTLAIGQVLHVRREAFDDRCVVRILSQAFLQVYKQLLFHTEEIIVAENQLLTSVSHLKKLKVF